MSGTAASTMPTTMRAWVFNTVKTTLEDAMELVDDYTVPDTFTTLPPAEANNGTGAVLVRILVASVNPADYKVPEVPLFGRYHPQRPAIPGADLCGHVVKSTSPNFAVGDLVAGKVANLSPHGTLTEYTVAPGNEIVSIPEGVSVDQAATIGICGMTAWTLVPYIRSLKDGTAAGLDAPIRQPRIFINGSSGGLGSFIIPLARSLGCHITATCSARNFDLVRGLGADDVIDYTTEDVAAALIKRASASFGKPFDLAADTVGMPFTSLLTMAHISLRPAFLGGGLRKAPTAVGKAIPEMFPTIVDLMVQGKLDVPIDEVYSFEDAPKAYTKLKTLRTRGKVIVRIAD
ncbi:zinc alcohol dehydrogenase [Ophiostoma piceae UAMH 11346]|uniref:Zinc alcohol dehydrogenase n=1 Tax=Ophiostoma piceae (strain UAMH 11346) TaxID=1262450 RepID=S3CR91_OPHP1|nr:zinc alcohol dehydrogenase [Ophiostoma piceae UAMH 11346]